MSPAIRDPSAALCLGDSPSTGALVITPYLQCCAKPRLAHGELLACQVTKSMQAKWVPISKGLWQAKCLIRTQGEKDKGLRAAELFRSLKEGTDVSFCLIRQVRTDKDTQALAQDLLPCHLKSIPFTKLTGLFVRQSSKDFVSVNCFSVQVNCLNAVLQHLPRMLHMAGRGHFSTKQKRCSLCKTSKGGSSWAKLFQQAENTSCGHYPVPHPP